MTTTFGLPPGVTTHLPDDRDEAIAALINVLDLCMIPIDILVGSGQCDPRADYLPADLKRAILDAHEAITQVMAE